MTQSTHPAAVALAKAQAAKQKKEESQAAVTLEAEVQTTEPEPAPAPAPAEPEAPAEPQESKTPQGDPIKVYEELEQAHVAGAELQEGSFLDYGGGNVYKVLRVPTEEQLGLATLYSGRSVQKMVQLQHDRKYLHTGAVAYDPSVNVMRTGQTTTGNK